MEQDFDIIKADKNSFIRVIEKLEQVLTDEYNQLDQLELPDCIKNEINKILLSSYDIPIKDALLKNPFSFPNAQWLLAIIKRMNSNVKGAKELLRKYLINPNEFFNIVFNFVFCYDFKCYTLLIYTFIKEIEAFSLNRILAAIKPYDDSCYESEVNVPYFFDILQKLDKNDSCRLLESLSIKGEIKNKLNDCLRNNDLSSFVTILNNTNSNIYKVALIAKMWYVIHEHIIPLSNWFDNQGILKTTNEEEISNIKSMLSNNLLYLPQEEASFLYRTIEILSSSIKDNPKFDIELLELYKKIREFIWYVILMHNCLFHLSSDPNAVSEMNRQISLNPYFNDIKKRVTIEGIDEMIKEDSHPLYDFYKQFVSKSSMAFLEKNNERKELKVGDVEFSLPDNFFNQKPIDDKSVYLGEMEYKYKDSKALAKLIEYLAVEDYVDDDIDTKENLVFRFTGRNMPEKLKEHIKWHKKSNDLYYLIKHLYPNGQGIKGHNKYKKGSEIFEVEFIDGKNYSQYAHRCTKGFKAKIEELFPLERKDRN